MTTYSHSANGTRSNRYRLGFKFWLDVTKADEEAIAEHIETLKAERRFAKTIRDGIRLVVDLRAGKTDVLSELFAWVLEPAPPLQGGMSEADRAWLESKLSNVRALSSTTSAPSLPSKPSLTSTPRTPSKPSIDDLDSLLDVKTATNTEDNKSNWNFAISSALAVFGNCNSLPEEVIHYGLRTKRIQPSHVTRKLKSDAPAPEPTNAPNGNARKLAGSDITFDAPVFDDDDLLAAFG